MDTVNSIAISIVIPVYNGSKFIEQTLNSLLSQTFPNFEIICVNDSSSDNSLLLLEKFAIKDSRIKIYTKINGGTAAKAINYGLQYASGNYFMYSSQDDLYSENLLEQNYNQACSLNAEAVIPHLVYYYSPNDLIRETIVTKNEKQNELTGREAFILSLDWRIHGFVLWDMKIVRKVGFFDFGLNSDEYTTRMLYFNSKKVVYSDGIFYYRQNNPNAITQKWTIKLLDYVDTNQKLIDFLKNNNFDNKEILKINKAILHDLIRIQLIFNKNKKYISNAEQIKSLQKINEIYDKYLNIIRTIEVKNLMQLIKKILQTSSYTSFQFYCRITQLYKFLVKY